MKITNTLPEIDEHARRIDEKLWQSFLDSGYTLYIPTTYIKNEDALLQKCICDKNNVLLYHINIGVYFFDKTVFPKYNQKDRIGLQPEVHFNNRDGKAIFNVTYFWCDGTPIDRIEKFFADIYTKMQCTPCGDS